MQKTKELCKIKRVLIMLIIIVMGVIVMNLNKGFQYDKKAENMVVDKKQQEVEEEIKGNNKNYFAISMNQLMQFEDGESESEFNIKNDALNDFILIVTIINTENDEVIYKSDGIKAGQIIVWDKLDTVLKKGKYICKVNYQAINKKTYKLEGTTQDQVEIVIRK